MTIERDNGIRQQAVKKFDEMMHAAVECFIEELKANPELPTIELTSDQLYSGKWKMPKVFQDLTSLVVKKMGDHHQYELTPSQKALGLLWAALQSGRLRLDGKQPKTL